MPSTPAPDILCPHYLPSAIGNPTIICPGCGSLIADQRHPQNAANGVNNTITVARPEVKNAVKNPLRRA